MKSLYLDGMPPATDVSGACMALAGERALVVVYDAIGCVSNLRKVIGTRIVRAFYESVNLPDVSYALDDPDELDAYVLDLVERHMMFGLEFVALVGGPVSSLLGMDLLARARALQAKTGLPVFAIETTGNLPYEDGDGKARRILERIRGAGSLDSDDADSSPRRIAVYGKGGIGKSSTTQNLAAALAADFGRRVMVVGCDPKADSTRLLTGVPRMPTVLDALRGVPASALDLNELVIEGFAGVRCVESGGPEPGAGCAGRGVVSAIDALEQRHAFGAHGNAQADSDYVFFDVLGDVVCGGFAMPIREGRAQEVLIVVSGEFMSLYAANNICRGIVRYAQSGGAQLAGLICNCRNVDNEVELVEQFACELGTCVLKVVPRDNVVQRAEVNRKTVVEYDPACSQAECYRDLAGLVDGQPTLSIPAPLSDERLEELVREFVR